MRNQRKIGFWISVCVFVLSVSFAFGDDFEGSIMTVRGAIPVSELGKTLSHEHVLVDFVGAEESGYHRWVRGDVISVLLPYLEDIQKLGYKSLF